MIDVPPRHGKSAQVTVRFPIWRLSQEPSTKFIVGSYNQTLSNKFSRQSRRLAAQAGIQLSKDRKAVEDWETAQEGGVRAVGVGGGVTGQGAHIIVIDDPVKSRKEVESETYREDCWNWYTEDIYSRLEPDGHIILIMTRWHIDDLAGRILASEDASDWTVIKLPAIADHDEGLDIIGRLPGEALCPERYDLEALARIQRVMSPESFLALYQQTPVAKGGNKFKRKWFNKRYNPGLLHRIKPDFIRLIQSVDTSFKDGVSNDYSVIATWAETATGYYLLDIWRNKVEYPDLIHAIRDNYVKWNPDVVLIEDAASGQSAIQTLRRDYKIPVEEAPAVGQGSKIARAESVLPLFSSDLVWLPEFADWIGDWIEEHLKFPAGKHDDQVDSTSIGLRYLKERMPITDIDQELREALENFRGF